MSVYGVYVVVMKVKPMVFTTFNKEGPRRGLSFDTTKISKIRDRSVLMQKN